METLFFVKVIVSFFAAGFWIAGTSILAERLGSEKGGLISILPSTVLISLIFVALVKNARFAASSTSAIPMGITINIIFLMVFILLLKNDLKKTVAISLFTWLILAFFAQKIHSSDFLINGVIYFLVVMLAFYILEYKLKITSKPQNRKTLTVETVLMRTLFGGTVVAGTTFLAGFAGSYWVGLFSTFPAVMLCSMIILSRSQGREFARALGKVMIISSSNIIVYAYSISLTYPSLGIIAGTLISFAFSCLWVLLLYPLVAKRAGRS